jgi:hypothetical protein
MHVLVQHADDVQPMQITPGPEALEIVRMGFNPSSLGTVDVLKLLAAAFIHECQKMHYPADSGAKRQLALAITHAETAAMFAVKAATAKAP